MGARCVLGWEVAGDGGGFGTEDGLFEGMCRGDKSYVGGEGEVEVIACDVRECILK